MSQNKNQNRFNKPASPKPFSVFKEEVKEEVVEVPVVEAPKKEIAAVTPTPVVEEASVLYGKAKIKAKRGR